MKAALRDERESVLLSLTSYTEPLKKLQICIGGRKNRPFFSSAMEKTTFGDDGTIQSTFHGYKLTRKEECSSEFLVIINCQSNQILRAGDLGML